LDKEIWFINLSAPLLCVEGRQYKMHNL
jgi:hypothetical protein